MLEDKLNSVEINSFNINEEINSVNEGNDNIEEFDNIKEESDINKENENWLESELDKLSSSVYMEKDKVDIINNIFTRHLNELKSAFFPSASEAAEISKSIEQYDFSINLEKIKKAIFTGQRRIILTYTNIFSKESMQYILVFMTFLINLNYQITFNIKNTKLYLTVEW